VPIDLSFLYHAEQRSRFADGSLVEHWFGTYKDMFDANDYRLARSQPGNHFFEWLAAVLFRESTGYHSLIEKYESANHPEKVATFKRSVNAEIFDFAMANRSGLPDLFVYHPATQDWFFCEVKGGSDRLSPRQRELHEQLEQLSKNSVRILWLQGI
jgi:hypothetical protein